jgi:hypothetical protein
VTDAPMRQTRTRQAILGSLSYACALALSVAAPAASAGPHAPHWQGHPVAPVFKVPVLDVSPHFERVLVRTTRCHARDVEPVDRPAWRSHRGAHAHSHSHGRDAIAADGDVPEEFVHGFDGERASGRELAHAEPQDHPASRRVTRCREVTRWDWRPAGYQVTYAVAGQLRRLHSRHHPGPWITLNVAGIPLWHALR